MADTQRFSIDVSTLSGWAGVSSGDHQLTIVAKASGYRDSEPSTAKTITKAPTSYTITPTLTNVTAKADNPQTILANSSATLTYYSDNGLNLPADVAVTGATKNSWVVTNEYAVSGAGTNCLINGQSSASEYVGTSETLVFNLSANGTTYKLPATLSIPNATYTRTSDTVGTLTFSGVSADQSFTVVAEEIQSGYSLQIETHAYTSDMYGEVSLYINGESTPSYTGITAGNPLSTTLNNVSSIHIEIGTSYDSYCYFNGSLVSWSEAANYGYIDLTLSQNSTLELDLADASD